MRVALLTAVALLSPLVAAGINDSICKFDLTELSCMPEKDCTYIYRFGDLNPDQSCRVNNDAVGLMPQQVHTAFAGVNTGSSMTITWTTYVRQNDPAVWIGSSPTSLPLSTATVTVATYYSDDDYTLFNYYATISGLTPHTKYAFQVGSKANAVHRSDVASFTTARAANDNSEYEVAFFGDLGKDKDAFPTINYINAKLPGKVDFVFHVGDISYADNAGLLSASEAFGFFYEQTYNKYMNMIAPVTTQMPYMVCPGNHEAECHSARCLLSSRKKDQLGNYQAYNTRFKMPSVESGASGAKNMWYSFESGPVHYTSISTETDYTDAPKNSFTGRKYGGFGNQIAWLEADLKKANANRANVPWLVVSMHRAIYTPTLADSNGNPTDEAAPVQRAFEDLFIKYNVDLVVAGHVHLYSRQLPVKKGRAVLDGVSADRKTYTNPKAPVYVISGAGGQNEGHKSYDASKQPNWNVVTDNTNWGIGKLRVSRTALRWSFVSTDDIVIDDFVIAKK